MDSWGIENEIFHRTLHLGFEFMAPVFACFSPKGGCFHGEHMRVFPNGFLQPWWDPPVPIRGRGLKLARGAAPWNFAGGAQNGGKSCRWTDQLSAITDGCVSKWGIPYPYLVIFFGGEDDLDMEAPYQTNPYGHSPQTSWILRLGSWPFSNLRSA